MHEESFPSKDQVLWLTSNIFKIGNNRLWRSVVPGHEAYTSVPFQIPHEEGDILMVVENKWILYTLSGGAAVWVCEWNATEQHPVSLWEDTLGEKLASRYHQGKRKVTFLYHDPNTHISVVLNRSHLLWLNAEKKEMYSLQVPFHSVQPSNLWVNPSSLHVYHWDYLKSGILSCYSYQNGGRHSVYFTNRLEARLSWDYRHVAYITQKQLLCNSGTWNCFSTPFLDRRK